MLDSVPSTNAVVAERARTGAAEGTVLVAESQTAGRGRLDRTWNAPPYAALTFSMLLGPDVPTARWPWLPLLTGVAVAEAVERVTGVRCRLKWPNDVLVEEQKLAGILLERVETPARAYAVVGVGLNVSATREELPVETATSLRLCGASSLDRAELLRQLLHSFTAGYTRWQAAKGDPAAGLLPAYLRCCDTVGRVVRVSLPTGETVRGTATGVDGSGRLVVSTSDGETTLGAGDVVHVRPDGRVT